MAKIVLAKKVFILFGEEMINVNLFGNREQLENAGFEIEEIEEEEAFRRVDEIIKEFQK
ncbi:MAG: hypothetical protein Q7S27_00780 [Nanoarchaeota archaeon]|nr:hypothetical protein [Nanoarchaeota archaeon]